MSDQARRWKAIARMNVALIRLFHASYFPRTLTIAEGLVLRAVIQHAYLWEGEGRLATVSKLAKALGVSRATARRKLNELIAYGYMTRNGRYYRCVEMMGRSQPSTLHARYTAIITETCKELEHSGQ